MKVSNGVVDLPKNKENGRTRFVLSYLISRLQVVQRLFEELIQQVIDDALLKEPETLACINLLLCILYTQKNSLMRISAASFKSFFKLFTRVWLQK